MGKKIPINPGQIMVKPYTLSELSNIYGVDWRTVKIWIEPYKEEIGTRRGRYYTIPQVRFIFDKLGLPSLFEAA